MKPLWQIRAVKTFLYLVLITYATAVLFPWVQVGLGYAPTYKETDSWSPSPIEYAAALSVSTLVYFGMFAVPLIVASLYTVRSLRKKYSAQTDAATKNEN